MADVTQGRPIGPGRLAPGGLAKVGLVVKREYLERVKTKAFIISTLLVPLFLGGMMLAPVFLARLAPDNVFKIAVVDGTGGLYDSLDQTLASDPDDDFLKPRGRRGRGQASAEKVRRYQLEEARPGPGGREPLLADLSARVQDESLDAYLLIPAEILTEAGVEPTYYGRTVSEIFSLRRIEIALSQVVVARRLAGEGVDPSKAKDLTRRVDLKTVKIGEKGETSKKDFGQEWIVTMAFVMMIYMNLIIYGSALARGLIEEKMNKVVEVLLSSVTPFQLLLGKIVGIGAVGLTQFVIWGGAAIGFQQYQAATAPGGDLAQLFEPAVLVYLVLYFTLGHFLYSALFAVVGAACTTEQEAQNAQMPVVMLLVVPMLIAIGVVRQPASTVAVALSHVPFFSPMVMMMRINVLTPPAWEILLNVAVILATIAGVAWAAGRVFRVGILMTGKRATIPEIVRWLRTA